MIFFRIPQKITGENYIDCYRGRDRTVLKTDSVFFLYLERTRMLFELLAFSDL